MEKKIKLGKIQEGMSTPFLSQGEKIKKMVDKHTMAADPLFLKILREGKKGKKFRQKKKSKFKFSEVRVLTEWMPESATYKSYKRYDIGGKFYNRKEAERIFKKIKALK